ncbi:MAG: HAMP domain-containing sensor histidine kinase [bacterium]
MKKSLRKILILDAKHRFMERWEEALGDWEVIFPEATGPAATFRPEPVEVLAVIGTPGALAGAFAGTFAGTFAKEKSSHPDSEHRNPAFILLTEDRELARHGNRIALPPGIRFLAHDASGAEIKRVIEEISRARQEGAQDSTSHAGDTQNSTTQERRKSAETSTAPWRFPEGKRFSSEIQFKEDWVKVVAHDIRSPLAIINSYARMLREAQYEISGQARLILERIQDTGGWMIDLIDNILDLSMIEEGRLTLKFKPVRLEEILSSVGAKMKFLADSKQVRLEWDASGDQNLYQLDHLKIEQVLHNLVTNGIKNSSEGDRIHISGNGDGGKVLFHVEDTGRGMTKEQAGGIFDKFSPQTSEVQSGKGLGLAIAKSIVELHGGKIWVESTPGKGSVFSFTVVPHSG